MNDGILKKTNQIAKYLITLKNSETIQSGLFSGSMGIALFLFYYARYSDSEYYSDKAMDFLELSLDNIDVGYNSTFCNGVSGLCWGINHLIENNFIDSMNVDVIETFDNYLIKDVLMNMYVNNYDYLHGAMGAAIYLLKRIKKESIRECQGQIVDLLYKTQIESGNGCYWEYKIGSNINISLSHGLSSTCIFLAKAYQAGVNKPIAKELLQKSIVYLLSQENKEIDRLSMFPSFSLNEQSSYNSRLGWCYGDLGVGLALWHYAVVMNDERIKQRAVDLFLFASSRRNLNQNAVFDAGICHGSAGIALIFRRMYICTGREEFRETANYWLHQTLLMSKYEDGVVGYKANGEILSLDFLNGIAGIGLVFLSFLTDRDITWDESLLLK